MERGTGGGPRSAAVGTPDAAPVVCTAEGATEGAAEGRAEGRAEGAAEGAESVAVVGGEADRLLQSFRLRDLVPLSVSSVGPMFSVAATGGVMAAAAGWWSLPAIAVLALPFVVSSFVFRLLNRHFPHAGASYHWSARIVGRGPSRYQAWVLILAYFFSIPPIAIPAGSYTLALIAPHSHAPAGVHMAVTLFWIGFAAVPLLLGGRPTARITQVFFGVEMISLAGFGVLGAMRWSKLSVPVHFGAPPWGGILVVAVVAATILDGWEIDSYASEESQHPRRWPGTSGVYGLVVVFALYMVMMPLITMETPLPALASSADPLATWVGVVMPSAGWAIDVAVIASTASSLWLTAFILSRAWYSMGRSGLLPRGFSRVHRTLHSPWVAIAAITGAEIAVQLLELTSSSVFAFFSLVLTAAGVFLLLEFALNGITATVHFRRAHRPMGLEPPSPHRHLLLVVLGPITAAGMLVIVAVGLVTNPYLAVIAGVLLVPSVYFLWRARRLASAQLLYSPLAEGEESLSQHS